MKKLQGGAPEGVPGEGGGDGGRPAHEQRPVPESGNH
jgi:hypothetical protein